MQLAQRHPNEAFRQLVILMGLSLAGTFLGFEPVFADDRPDGAELATAGAMMVVIGIFFIAGILGIWWAWSHGEFEEPEEVKYSMLAMIENEPDYWGMGSHDNDEDEDTPSSPDSKHKLLGPAI
jgi:hypothetical protein